MGLCTLIGDSNVSDFGEHSIAAAGWPSAARPKMSARRDDRASIISVQYSSGGKTVPYGKTTSNDEVPIRPTVPYTVRSLQPAEYIR